MRHVLEDIERLLAEGKGFGVGRGRDTTHLQSAVSPSKAHQDFVKAAREFEESLRRAYFAGEKLRAMHAQWEEIPGQTDELEDEVDAVTDSLEKYIKPAHTIYKTIKSGGD